MDRVAPLPEHMEAISYEVTKPLLARFRELLKKKTNCYCDKVLQKLFEESRREIANSVHTGIKMYVPTRWAGQLS